MRTRDKRVVGTLLAATVGLTSATVLSSPVEAAQPNMIQGVVTAADGTSPLAGIHVTALAERLVGGVTQWVEVGTATTGDAGAFNVSKLVDGNYKVRFDDPAGNYATEFYDDAFRPADANVLDVSNGKFRTADVSLGGGAHLSGLVTGSTGSGIAGAEVTVYVLQDSAWTPLTTIETAENGRYDLGLLPGGSYTLGFRDPVSGVTEYWNDKASLAEANTLTIKSAGSNDGLNAQLATPLPEPTPQPTTDPTTVPNEAPAAPAPATSSTTAATTTTTTAAATKVVMVKAPRIRGLAKVSEVLRVTRGTWNPTTVSRKLQWLANGKRIKGATKARLRLTQKLVGKRLSVRVVASAPQLTKLVVKTRTTKKIRR